MSKEKAKSNSKNNSKSLKTYEITFARTDWWTVQIPAENRSEATKALVNDSYDKTTETLITEAEVKGSVRVPKAKPGERQKFHVDEDHRQGIFIESVNIKE